jgi:hypothetical protein
MKHDDREAFDEWIKQDEGVRLFSVDMREAYKYFAWLGWQAALVHEREDCAELCASFSWSNECKYMAEQIKARGGK